MRNKLFNINKSTYDMWRQPCKPLSFKDFLKAAKKALDRPIDEDIFMPVHPDSILGREIQRREKIKKSKRNKK